MNYHKNTDSSAPPRRESRKRFLNPVAIVLSKNGFRVDAQNPPPEPAAPPPVVQPQRKRRKK